MNRKENSVMKTLGQQLFNAAKRGQQEVVEELLNILLECSDDVVKYTSDLLWRKGDKTPLRIAVIKKKTHIVRRLLEVYIALAVGIEDVAVCIDLANKNQYYAGLGLLQSALRDMQNHTDAIRLDDDAGLDVLAPSGVTPIDAVWSGDLVLLQQSLNSRHANKRKDAAGRTLLMIACLSGHIELVTFLVSQKSVDVNARSKAGETAYSIAIKYGRGDIAAILKSHHADTSLSSKDEVYAEPLDTLLPDLVLPRINDIQLPVLDQDTQRFPYAVDSLTLPGKAAVSFVPASMSVVTISHDCTVYPLQDAMVAQEEDTVPLASKSEISPSAADDLSSDLLAAVSNRDYSQLSVLTQSAGIDVNKLDDYRGISAFYLACEMLDEQAVSALLLIDGVDTCLSDADGVTPFMKLCMANNNEVQLRLLNKLYSHSGSNITLTKDFVFQTISDDRQPIFEWLVEHGFIDLSVTNNDGLSLAEVAEAKHCVGLQLYLLNKEIDVGKRQSADHARRANTVTDSVRTRGRLRRSGRRGVGSSRARVATRRSSRRPRTVRSKVIPEASTSTAGTTPSPAKVRARGARRIAPT